MRVLKFLLLGLAGLAILVVAGVLAALRSEAVWTWGGHHLVAMARERLFPALEVARVYGHPLTGLTFEGIRLAGPEGEILRAERLELRFSLWSMVRLRPIISRVALLRPHLTVWWLPDGELNLARVLKPRPPPPFRSLDVAEIQVTGGELEVKGPGRVERYGPADFQAAVTVLHPKQPRQKVLVRRAVLSLTAPPGRLQLAGRLTAHLKEVEILDLTATLEEEMLLKGGGRAFWGETPGARLALEVGPVGGEVLHRLLPSWPKAWPLQGRFQVEAAPDRISLAGEATLAEAPLALTGSLSRQEGIWTYALKLESQALPVSLLQPFRPDLAATMADLPPLPLSLTGRGAGFHWPPARMEWRLTAGSFSWRGVKVEGGQASLTGDAREQTLTVSGQGNFGHAAATLKGPLLTHTQGELHLEARELQPALLGLAAPGGTRINGRFRGTCRWPRLALTGEFTGSGRLGELTVQEARGQLAWEHSRLELREVSLRAPGLQATGKGSLTPQGLEARLQARLTGGVPLLPGPRFTQGEVTLTVSGPVAQPRASLAATFHGFTYAGLTARSLSLSGTFTGWPPAGGGLTLTAAGLSTPAADFPRAQVSLKGVQDRWQLTGSASGTPENQLQLAGELTTRTRPLHLTLSRLTFTLGKISGEARSPVRLTFLPGVRLEPAVFSLNGGRLEAEGRWAEGQVAARLEGRELPAGLVGVRGVPLRGKIGLKAVVSGTPAWPAVTAEASLSQGGWGRLEVRSATAGLSYAEGLLRLSGRLEEARRGSRLTLQGRLPWRLTLAPFSWGRGEGEVNVVLAGENFNLAVLPALTREVTEADLPLEFRAIWEGPAARPRLGGFCRWGEGFLTFRLGGARYQVAAGSARLEGTTLTIPELLLTSDGTARLWGTLTLTGFLPDRFDLKGELSEFKALSRLGSEATGSGTLTLTGPLEDLLVAGRLTVTRAVFRPLFFETGTSEDIVLVRKPPAPGNGPPGTPAFIRRARMEITLEAPHNVWVRDKRANLEMAGRLLAFKEPEGPVRLRGDLRVVQGTVEVHGKPFTVKEGTVHLPGRPPELITVKGRAEHQLEDVLLILEMSGPAAKPVIRLSSLPPLPPADLLSYMAFGQKAAALTKEQYSSVSPQAVGLIGGLTTKKLLDFLGKDFPLLGDLYFTGGPERVGVGKPLTRDIRISFERVTDPLTRTAADHQVRLEYRLGRRFSVESQVGRRNSGADVFWNFDF